MKGAMSDLDELRDELDEFAQPAKKGGRSSHEERIIAGFEEILQFVKQHGRPPMQGEGKDIFERIYAVRLDRLRGLEECRSILAPFDTQGLLGEGDMVKEATPEYMSNDELAAELGGSTSLSELRHVRSRAEIEAAEEIANREKCKDFEKFEPLFQKAERELKSGERKTIRFGKDAAINRGNFFILAGQLVYIAEVGEEIKAPNGANDARLRAVYSNGTESNLLRRSLQRALYKDETGRRLTDPNFGPLFGESPADDDHESGTIYVLRSRSSHPYISEHHELIHKIGVTGGKVETRIANAVHDATYLLAEVEIVATYKLVDINRVKLENLFHRIFAPAQIEITIPDRFGNPVQPREWFLVPLPVIDEVVKKIRDGSITKVIYDPKTASLIPR
jgi:hypothetical protein